MKSKKKNFFASVLVGMLAIAPLCYGETSSDKTSIEEVKKETKELLQTLNAYTVDQRDEAIAKTKEALDNLDKRIDALQRDVDENRDKMDRAAREKARSGLKELHKQRAQVAEQYDSLKESTGEAWEHMKKGFSDAYKDLADAWEKSEKEFGSKK